MKITEIRNTDFFNTIVTRENEGSMLLLTKKKILLSKRKIIVESSMPSSLLQYQPDIGEEYGQGI